jgi:N-acetylglucosamine-6-phosphate deacetylase
VLNGRVIPGPPLPISRVLTAKRVVLDGGRVDPGWVEIANGVITATGSGILPGREDEVLDGWLLPGFVDQHCHGGGGAAFESHDPADIRTAARTHLRHGTTSLVASLVSLSRTELPEQVARLVPECEAQVIAGIHLEGPWLSRKHKGAHDPQNLRDPSPQELEVVLEAGQGHVKMVTIAPELPGAIETIRACVANGVVAAVGHTDATYQQAVDAVDAGATVATHLFNAMPAPHHRRPGPVAALTEDPRVAVEMIVDGFHLHPGVVRLTGRAASYRVVLVTDAMAAAGYSDGDYDLGGLAVQVRDGFARLVDGGAIAGSTLTMDSAFRRYVAECGAPVVEAVSAASKIPARLMKLWDRGELRVGARADICHLDEQLNLQGVWRAGDPVELLADQNVS